MFVLLAIIIIFLPWQALWAETNHSPFSHTECTNCHKLSPTNHVMGKPTDMYDSLPLENGKMTCITCHDCSSGTCRLRIPKGKICIACHECDKTCMVCSIDTPHLGSSKNISKYAEMCITCHDGVTSKIHVRHPSFVPYKNGRKFRIITDNRVIITNGQITCLSCHNPFSTQKKRLVMDNRGSKLCLSCHLK